jgi:uncharacterized glyoxalase superfamily protein PhnB
MAATAPAPTVWITLRYDDALGAIRFLVDTFGFEERAVYTDEQEPSLVHHAELRWPEGGGVMLGSSQRTDSSIAELPAGVGSAYVVTDRPDQLYSRAVEAGAKITHDLQDEDYGSRGFTCRDPQGVFWSFGTYRGHAG